METHNQEYKPYNPSLKVFGSLSLSEDKMAQMYALGYEKKEIADLLCKAYSTVVNTIRSVYEKLQVRNRSELTARYAEQKCNIRLTLDFSPQFRQVIASVLLFLIVLDMHQDMRVMRRGRARNNTETTSRVRIRSRGKDLPLTF